MDTSGLKSEILNNMLNSQDGTSKEIFSSVFRKYYPVLLFFACKFLDEKKAEDIVQDAFVELWERHESLEMGDQILSFMYKSVYSKIINHLRHEAVVKKYTNARIEIYKKELDYYCQNNNALQIIENQELKQQISEAIGQLPDKCKEVFKLSYIYNLKNKEIADILNISLRTVEAHMYKALKFLRTSLSSLNFFIALLLIFRFFD